MKTKNHALILIDAQKGFADHEYWGRRNNPDFEKNVLTLLEGFRELKLPVLHVQHLSIDPKSPLRPGQVGAEFMEGLGPILGERVFQKMVNSAFIGTNLEVYLKSEGLTAITFAGLTTDHCVSTTTRMASNLGFQVAVVADATATHERKGMATVHPAELVHEISLASLRGEFATICEKATDLIHRLRYET